MKITKRFQQVALSTWFLITFFALLIAMNLGIGLIMIHWSYSISVLYFVIMQVLNIGLAYELTEMGLSLLIRDHDLPKLKRLRNRPQVAILYLTCDDVLPEALNLSACQTYSNCEVFVLDDSADPRQRKLVDQLGFTVVRRPSRTGFKAGSLNNWLFLYGQNYKYCVVLDSDSVVGTEFVENMLKYAEHPANKRVAIFQSRTRSWNTEKRFARVMALLEPVWAFPVERLANRCETLLPWGHNMLCRIKPLFKVSGFTTDFVSEDYATALNLTEEGYQCRLVNILSWDTMPENVHTYTRRLVRWGRGITEIVKTGSRSVPFITNLRVLMTAYSYFVHFVYLLGMIVVVWGYHSSLGNVWRFVEFILTGEFLHSPFRGPLFVIGLYLLFYLIVRPLYARRLSIGAKEYLVHTLLGMAAGFYALFPLLKGLIRTLIGERTDFVVTSKRVNRSHLSLLQIISSMKSTLLLIVTVLIGLIVNPLALLFNFIWIVPLFATPIVLYLYQNDSVRIKMLE